MNLTFSHGLAHAEPHSATAGAHTIRVRLGAGFGKEALGASRLESMAWPSGAMEYLPPGMTHTHATHIETDWLTLALDDEEWELAACDDMGSVSPVSCNAGLRYAGDVVWLRRAYLQSGEACESREVVAAEVAAAFVAAWNRISCKPETKTLSLATLRRLAQHVEAHLDTDIECLAREAGLSRYYFISAFRRAAGCTPHQYLIARRLGKARKLLLQTRSSITDIAFECGFSSHAHLTATFSRHFGVTPTAYRHHHTTRLTPIVCP